MAETRTALGEIQGRVFTLDRQLASERKDADELREGLRAHEGRITGLMKLREDYVGLLAKLEA